MTTSVRNSPVLVERGLRALADPPGWLLDAAAPGRVHAALERTVPEFVSGSLRLVATDVGSVRAKGSGWQGTYRLSVQDPGSGATERIDLAVEIATDDRLPRHPPVETRFGTPGWRGAIPSMRAALTAVEPEDAALPSLSTLTDPDGSRALLERAIREGTRRDEDFSIIRCMPRVARYKPGSRCTIVYELGLPDGSLERGWPSTVVAKTYHGGKGLQAFAAMKMLWQSPLRRTGRVAIAEPLAFLPDENVLVQGPVPGTRTIKDLLLAPDDVDCSSPGLLDRSVRRAGRGLADLHGCGVTPLVAVTWEDEYLDAARLIERVHSAIPTLAAAVQPLLEWIGELADACPPDPSGPAHGSFRPAQVMLDGESAGFIDFDGFCSAEPALNVALFRATVRDMGLRGLRLTEPSAAAAARARRIDELDALCLAFSEEYEATAGVSRARVALWEALSLLNLSLHCWTKAKFDLLDDRLELLRRHLLTGELPGNTR